jgi:hypothetical protein
MIAIFLFYNVSSGPQAKLAFSKEFRHCNVITYDGKDWVLVEFDLTGLYTSVLKVTKGESLIRNLRIMKSLIAQIVVEINTRHPVRWKPWWVRSCNELDRYVTGVNIGLTFNPRHLYNKLIKYSGKRNFQILETWRRTDGIFRG